MTHFPNGSWPVTEQPTVLPHRRENLAVICWLWFLPNVIELEQLTGSGRGGEGRGGTIAPLLN